ncbi:MAG: 2-hydroxychromene-2-carboxylate isomerase [Xanthobacteraceae bacterium]
MNGSAVASESRPEIEFWFEFGSNYSYLSVMRIEDAAQRCGVRIAWKPFLLGPIFRALGMETSPFVLQKEKGVYVWQDMVRQCRKYGLRWVQPSTFPRLGVLPLRIALLGINESWIGAFCRQVMELNFVLDQDINEPNGMTRILMELGLPASDILAQAQAEPIKSLLRAQTEEARARGIFGAPTFFVGTEMFWGNDRLDDALLCASDGSRSRQSGSESPGAPKQHRVSPGRTR